MKNRIKIICLICKKEKNHAARSLCHSCFRTNGRRTSPLLYLKDTYRKLKRRTTEYDNKRPNYYGLMICTKDEFINKFLNDKDFLMFYTRWQENSYKRSYSPTIDRRDNKLGYIIENIQFISHFENTGKDRRIQVELFNKKTGIALLFSSHKATAIFLKVFN